MKEARLQKRIMDLEQYKLASGKYSSQVLKKHEDDENKKIDEIAAFKDQLASDKKKKE